MPKKEKTKSWYAEIDAASRFATGRPLTYHARRWWNIFGKEAAEELWHDFSSRFLKDEDNLWPESYQVLGIAPGVSDLMVKAAYKIKAQEVHPDKGGTDEAFKKVQAAYEAICQERGMQP